MSADGLKRGENTRPEKMRSQDESVYYQVAKLLKSFIPLSNEDTVRLCLFESHTIVNINHFREVRFKQTAKETKQ